MSDSKSVYLTDADFDEKVAKAKEEKMPVFVDFFAEWCGPCKMAAPIVDNLSKEFDGKVMIAKLNVDENPQTAQKFGVMSIPTFVRFTKDGSKLDDVRGFPGEAEKERTSLSFTRFPRPRSGI